MSFKVLARKWRPKNFAEVVGQEQVVRTLENALGAGRVAHAYLFAGVRGTGKTTAARILARALNCMKDSHPTASPCGECDACREILAGSDLDLYEIDAASHTGVDKVRELIENIRYSPARNRYKVFIIDEVHMLSTAAFNALLKTIEEPPEYVVFILATTELHRIPATILSRCQQFPFRRLESAEIQGRLEEICTAEKVEHEARSLATIAEAGNGSLRDALSILDQAITFGGGRLAERDVEQLLGRLDRRFYQELLRAALEGSPAEVVRAVSAVVDAGADPRAVYRDLERYSRGILLLNAAPGTPLPEGLSENDATAMAALAAGHSYEELLRAYDLLIREDGFVRRAEDPRLAFELVLLKIRELGKLRPIEDIIRDLAGGGGARRAAAPTGSDDRDETHPPRFTRIAAVKPEPGPEPAPVPPPARPQAASVDLFRKKLSDAHPRLAGFLGLADRLEFHDTTIRISFGPAHASTREILEGAKNRSDLARVAEEVFGDGTVVRVELTAPPAGDLGQAAASVTKDEIRRDRLAGKVNADPLVQATLELFRGEITEISEHSEEPAGEGKP